MDEPALTDVAEGRREPDCEGEVSSALGFRERGKGSPPQPVVREVTEDVEDGDGVNDGESEAQ